MSEKSMKSSIKIIYQPRPSHKMFVFEFQKQLPRFFSSFERLDQMGHIFKLLSLQFQEAYLYCSKNR